MNRLMIGVIMDPKIDSTIFGSITINGQKYSHDVLVRLDGTIKKRKKKLSKKVYGTSHKLSLAEAEHIYEDGVEKIIFGTGQFDRAHLSEQAEKFFGNLGVELILSSTPRAINEWNETFGNVVGLFHVTC
jgi:hypothetical protein